MREVGFDLRSGVTRDWFFDDDGRLTDNEISAASGWCCGRAKFTPPLRDREMMTHARELMDEWLLVSQAKRFRDEVVDT
jgi:hypothetical protein